MFYFTPDGRRFIRADEIRHPDPGEYYSLGAGTAILCGSELIPLNLEERAFILQEAAEGRPLRHEGQRFYLTGEKRLPRRGEWYISTSDTISVPIVLASQDYLDDGLLYEIVVPEGEKLSGGLRILFSPDGAKRFIPTGRLLKPLRGEWYMNKGGQICQATRGFKNDSYEIMSPISCEE